MLAGDGDLKPMELSEPMVGSGFAAGVGRDYAPTGSSWSSALRHYRSFVHLIVRCRGKKIGIVWHKPYEDLDSDQRLPCSVGKSSRIIQMVASKYRVAVGMGQRLVIFAFLDVLATYHSKNSTL